MFFDKDKDLIHRLINLILIVWLVVAIVILYSSTVDIIVKKDNLSYNEYKAVYCKNNIETGKGEEKPIAFNCEDEYARYKIQDNDENFYYKKSIIYAVGNVVIVGIFLILLNKKRD